MKTTIILTCIFLLTSCASTEKQSDPMVVGGREVSSSDDNYPSVVFLGISKTDDTEEECSAAFISPNMALTAAHCMDFDNDVSAREVGILDTFKIYSQQDFQKLDDEKKHLGYI